MTRRYGIDTSAYPGSLDAGPSGGCLLQYLANLKPTKDTTNADTARQR